MRKASLRSSCSRRLSFLDQLMKELAQLCVGGGERRATGCSCPILPPKAASFALFRRPQIAFFVHAAQHGIERARTKPVAVPAQFLNHPVTDQRLFGGMMQDVQPNET